MNVSPNKMKYFSGCFQVYGHDKIEWKEDWFECEYALNHITVQNWTAKHMSQTMEYWWVILPNWVVPNQSYLLTYNLASLSGPNSARARELPNYQLHVTRATVPTSEVHFILWTAWVLSKLHKMNIFTGCPLPRLVLHLISYFWP